MGIQKAQAVAAPQKSTAAVAPTLMAAPWVQRAPERGERLSRAPQSAGRLQRAKCACGSEADASGMCAECRAKHDNEQHRLQRLIQRKAQCAPQLAVQRKMTVNPPGDALEQEAETVARGVVQRWGQAEVQRAPAPAAPPPAVSIQRAAAIAPVPEVTPALESSIQAARGGGQPLADGVRAPMEQQMGADFGGVRVHADANADQMSRALEARAFTTEKDVFFRSGEYNPGSAGGKELLAHELTHTVQQGASVARAPVQRGMATDAWNAATGAAGSALDTVVDAGGKVATGAGELVGDALVATIRKVAPNIVALVEEVQAAGGIGAWLKKFLVQKLTGAFNALGGSRDRPIANLVATIGGIVESSDQILAGLQSGDCGPLFTAMGQLGDALGTVAGDAWNSLVEFLRPVGEFFSGLWKQYGAPFIEWVKTKAADVWDKVTSIASKIWKWTEPVRDMASAAWKWVKDALGIGEGPEGQDGLLQWITGKLSEQWEQIKDTLRPLIEPIRDLAQTIYQLLPMNAIQDLRKRVMAWLKDQQNFVQNMTGEGEPPAVVENRETLRTEILPAIMAAMGRVRAALIGAGQWVGAKIGALGGRVSAFMAELRGNPYLGVVAQGLGWIETSVSELVEWAQGGVTALFGKLGDALVYASKFIRPILDTLEKLAAALGDLMGSLGDLVLGPLKKAIPACIRNPIWDFIVNQILKNIPFFSKLMEIPNVWEKLAQTAMRILRTIFVDGNIAKAAWLIFKELLSLLGIPPELVVQIVNKTLAVFSDILADPISFFQNLLLSIKQGFIGFFDNIWTHLLTGVLDWLFGQVADAGIAKPTDFSLGSIFKLVLEVLGISFEKIMRKVEAKNPKLAGVIRAGAKVLGVAWRWISILIEKGPAGVWEEIQTQVGNIKDMVIQSVTGWIQSVIVEKVITKLISSLDPTGIGAVVNSIIAIYQAIQAAVAYINDMLQIVNKVLDGVGGIVKGAIEQAAKFLEGALAKAIPVAIGFLAYQVGLGKIGEKIRDAIESLREKVDKGIDWLIDKGLKALEGIGSALGIGGKKVRIGEFADKKEGHEIFVDMEAGEPELEIHSTLVVRVTGNAGDLEFKLKNLAKMEKGGGAELDDETRKEIEDARAIIASILSNTKQNSGSTSAPGSGVQQPAGGAAPSAPSVVVDPQQMATLRTLLQKLYDKFAGSLLAQEGSLHYIADSEGRPVQAYGYLSSEKGGRTGDQDAVSSPVNALMGELGSSLRWDAAHLIGDQYGGSGARENLVPATSNANKSWHTTYERLWAEQVKQAHAAGKLIYVKVEVTYPSDKNPANRIIEEEDLENLRINDPARLEKANQVLRRVPEHIWWIEAYLMTSDEKKEPPPITVPHLLPTRESMGRLATAVTRGWQPEGTTKPRPKSGGELLTIAPGETNKNNQ